MTQYSRRWWDSPLGKWIRRLLWFTPRGASELSATLPPAWRQILLQQVPLYARLPDVDRAELDGHILELLRRKKFIGAQGLKVTDTMRVVICAHAGLLLLHRPSHYFPKVDTIVIYPTPFVSPVRIPMGSGLYLEQPMVRIGESDAHNGVVVLAWSSIDHVGGEPRRGSNVVMHEFTHQLDAEDGAVDGAPLLSSGSAYRAWSSVMVEEFASLREMIAAEHATFIDHYGATSPAEFFAVLTEAFFERPAGLKFHHPRLYHLLSEFYRLDPEHL